MMKQVYYALVSRRDASALLIVIAVMAVYANSLDNAFQYDDRHSIVENPHIRSLQDIPAFFTHPEYFSRDADKAMYRPLLLLSFALNYAWGQYDVSSYHLVNVSLHLICALLVWGILRHIHQPPCMSLLGAVFFAVHPLATEPVNYISSRSELMAAAGVLAGFLLYLRSEEKKRAAYQVASALCFAAGLMSKSVALVLPLWIVIWQWHSGRLSTTWSKLWPYALVAVAYVLTVRNFLIKAVLSEPVRSWPEQLGTQAKALIYYAMLFFAPFKLNVDHGFTTSGFGELIVILSALALASLFFLLGGLSRLGILWILTALLPTLLVPLNVLVNEHRLYLPLVGLVIALLGMRSLQALPGLRWGTPIFIALFGLMAFERNRVWSDEVSLWGDAAVKNPGSVRPLVYLGNATRQRGQLELAERYYRRALQLEADHPTVRANLANVYQDLGRYDLAIATFAQVLVEHPGMTDVHYSLGRVYQEAGRANEAIEQYQALPLASPQRKFADNNIGTIFQVAGKIDSALYYYGRAGQFVQARSNRARLINGQVEQVKHLLDRGQFLDAENLARLLRTADGSHRDAHFMLAVALFLQKRYDESSAVNRRLVEEHPRFDEGFLQLALVQESSGRLGDAQVTYQTLIAGTGREEMRQIGTERLRALEERMP